MPSNEMKNDCRGSVVQMQYDDSAKTLTLTLLFDVAACNGSGVCCCLACGVFRIWRDFSVLHVFTFHHRQVGFQM